MTSSYLKSLIDQSYPILVIDARGDRERGGLNIGGYHCPPSRIVRNMHIVRQIGRNKQIVIACKPAKNRAKRIQSELRKKGIHSVILDEGISGFKKLYPTTRLPT